MNKTKILFIIFFVIFILISVFFFSSMGNFTGSVANCENNAGTCSIEECNTIGMQEHVDATCSDKKGKVYEERHQYCCIRKLI